jgi:hypothetical protein
MLMLVPARDELGTHEKHIPLDGRRSLGNVGALGGIGGLPGTQTKGWIGAGSVPELLGLLGPAALSAAATAAVAWLQGRAGRKVRLKVGDTEVEARTVAELKEMIALTRDMQKRPPEDGA